MEHGVRPDVLVATAREAQHGPNVLTGVARFVLRGVERLGVDADAVSKRCKLRPWRDYGTHVPASLLHDVWEQATRVSGETDLGVRLAATSDIRDFGSLLGDLTRSSATIGDALIQLSRTARVTTSALHISLLVDGERVTWSLDPHAAGCYHPQHIEFVVANSVLMVRRMARTIVHPAEVTFRHTETPGTGARERLFGAPIRFGAARDSFEFDSSILSRQLTTHEPELYEALSKTVDQMQDQSAPELQLLRKVRKVISANLATGMVSAEQVAQALDLHEKTLARRLRAIGTTYKEVLEALRFEAATHHLLHSEFSIDKIASALGYSDKTAFHRAFRRWSGSSPQQFRANMSRANEAD